MAQRQSYETRRRERPPPELPKSERQAGFLAFQIASVVLLLLLVWSIKLSGAEIYGGIKKAGEELLSGQKIALSYEALESFLSGDFVSPIDSVLKRMGLGGESDTEPAGTETSAEAGDDAAITGKAAAMGGSFAGVLGGSGGPPKMPENCSFSPLLLSAQVGVPVSGTITSAFGWRDNPTAAGNVDFHTGIDIAAAEGTAIIAALPGTVEDTGYSESYGNYVKLSHGGGLLTTYSHCAGVIAKSGERVRRGERIARVGSTGNSTGPHLHFEIQSASVCRDPLEQLLFSGEG